MKTYKDTLILITGCTQGLGKALAKSFTGDTCICINRTKNAVTDIVIDLAENSIDIKLLSDLFNKYATIIYINNASTIEPINEIRNIEIDDIRYATNLNFFNPSCIVSTLVQTQKKYIVLNITTGAAFTSNTKLSIYSATKAAMHRFVDILEQEELANPNALLVKNFDPGRMKTKMQETLILEKKLDNTINNMKNTADIANELTIIIKKVIDENA